MMRSVRQRQSPVSSAADYDDEMRHNFDYNTLTASRFGESKCWPPRQQRGPAAVVVFLRRKYDQFQMLDAKTNGGGDSFFKSKRWFHFSSFHAAAAADSRHGRPLI